MNLFLVAHGCPNCHGRISDTRLAQGLPCEQCLPEEGPVCETLKRQGNLKFLGPFCEVEERLGEIENLWVKALGYLPSSLQRTWLKRLLLRESFAIVAPTGTGKTTFGLLATLVNGERALILVPTKLLVQQIGERLEELAQKAELKVNILAYQGRKKDKQSFEERNFDILIATTAFFYRHAEELKEVDFKLVFIDDVDSFLKRSAHVDRLFGLLGFSEREIALALKLNKSEGDLQRLEKIRQRHAGQKILIMSSATLRPRTNRVMLFRFLLGFDVHRAVSNIRNIVDAKTKAEEWNGLLERAFTLSRILGPGGLLFVSSIYGRDKVEETVDFLREKGLRVLSYLELSPGELMQEMEKGQFDLAVGLAHPTNPLVRGIDLPFVLKYALFLGVPRHLFPTKVSLAPQGLHNLLAHILPLLEEEERLQALADLQYLRRYLTLKEEALERYPKIKARAEEIKKSLEEKFKDPQFLTKLETSEEVFLKREGDSLYLVVGDTATYLQASGRVSRLTLFGLLKGLSVVLTDDPRALASLERRLRFHLGDDFTFTPVEDLDLKALAQELIEVRKKRSTPSQAFKDLSHTTLVLVESPHKAKTIASFWGKPTIRRVGEAFVYEIPIENRVLMVTASLGHVFNLSRRRGFFGVYEKGGYFEPVFDTIKICRPTGEQLVDPEEVKIRCPQGPVFDKGDLLEGLRRLAFEIDEVFIGSDPDAEGEKIAYDLFIELRPFNPRIKRLEFHEVTPKAFRSALEAPVEFNLNRVKAQLTRRVVDRWVGFTLSRKLWSAFGRRRLSAGRVQTPVLGWVIARAEEARKKKARLSFVLFEHRFHLELEDIPLAKQVFKELEALKWEVLARAEETKNPLPPYTTDTILQDAHQRLRLSTKQTMALLQELFESGLITYHRTDSTRVSEAGRYQVAKPYITEHFGEEFFYPRGWAEGGAHEAIRPTRPREAKELQAMIAGGLLSLSDTDRALKLYDLIFRRFMASQMRAAKVEITRLRFMVPSYQWEEAIISAVLEPGFEKMYPTFVVVGLQAEGKPTKPMLQLVPKAELYTEGTLVQEMKRRGLGRPSTYAEIVTTLIQRRYVKVLKGGRLLPTKLGREVYQYLKKNFPHQVDEELTRRLEEAMDLIEAGELDYQKVLQEAYEIRHLLEEERVELYPEEELKQHVVHWE